MELDTAQQIVYSILGNRQLSDIQELVFSQSWQGKTYAEIAKSSQYDPDYIREIGSQLWRLLSDACGEKVTKKNFRTSVRRLYYQSQTAQFFQEQSINTSHENILEESPSLPPPKPLYQTDPQNAVIHDWLEAPQNSFFIGRQDELQSLSKAILHDRCQLLGVFGMGGVGKTAIALELAQTIQPHFDAVLWRSLRNAPFLTDLLVDIIHFFSGQKDIETNLPADTSGRIAHLLSYLKSRRCLLILDNVESVLRSHAICGQYRLGYEDYHQLFMGLGEYQHQSCSLITSREKPPEFNQLEGLTLSVRAFELTGVSAEVGKRIVLQKGDFSATQQAWTKLVETYSGNPLALKISGAAIQDLFDGSLDKFFNYDVMIFDDIDVLLNEQFNRLSAIEQKVMYWLAIEREPITLETLEEDILQSISKSQLFESVKSLIRRSLLYKTDAGFTQQPVVMEYIIDKLKDAIASEICSESPHLLIDYALTKSQTKEYIRASQTRVILEPIKLELLERLNTKEGIEQKLQNVLKLLRQEMSYQTGYSVGNIINLLQNLDIDMSGYDLSNLLIRQADLQNTDLKQVNLQGARLQDITVGNNYDYFFAVTINSTGQFVAIGGAEGTIMINHFPSMEPYANLVGHRHWINELEFSPDNQLLVSVSTDHTARVWDYSSSECIVTLKEHASPVSAAVFTPDSHTLITSAYDGSIKFWDTQTWTCFRTIQETTGPVGAIALSPNGQTLVSGSFDGLSTIYDLATFEVKRTKHQHQNLIWCVEFHPSGDRFFTGSHDHTVMEWDIETGQLHQQYIGHTGQITCLSCPQDGGILASGSHDQSIRIWNIHTGQCIRVLQGHQRDVWSIDFCPRGLTLVSVGLDYCTKLWDVKTGYSLKTMKGSHGSLWSLAFSGDGTQLISGGENGQIRIWDLERQEYVMDWKGHDSEVTAIAIPANDHLFATGSGDRTVKIWDIASGQCKHILTGHTDWIWSIAFNPKTEHLASAGRNDTIHIWDINTGECLQTIKGGHQFFIWSIAYSHDGKIFASASYDGTLKLWNTDNWHCISTLVGHQSFINTVCFHPNNSWIASAGYDQTIKIWNIHTTQCIQTLQGHSGIVWSVTFSPNGHQLSSTSTDGTVKVWNTQTGRCLRTLKGHQGSVLCSCFHPNEQTLASSSRDGTIRVWDIRSKACLMVLSSPKLYEGLNISDVQGLTDQQRAMFIALGAKE